MKLVYDGTKLSKEVKTKRLIELDLDMRTCAINIGISAATLSRIENGKTPDIETLATVCHWISKPINDFFSYPKTKKQFNHK